jgi:hypothetical protein
MRNVLTCPSFSSLPWLRNSPNLPQTHPHRHHRCHLRQRHVDLHRRFPMPQNPIIRPLSCIAARQRGRPLFRSSHRFLLASRLEYWLRYSDTAYAYACALFATHAVVQASIHHNRLRCQYADSDSIRSATLGCESLGEFGTPRDVLWWLHYLLVRMIDTETTHVM